MRPFAFQTVDTPTAAAAAAAGVRAQDAAASPVQFLAGGTTLIDLMKLDVMRPERVVDINALGTTALGRIEATDKGLRLGALVRMAEAADHETINKEFPAIAQALQLAASPQIRNMASLGGNVLQRTRCPYFRDVSYAQCNKRDPGSGCAAMDGFNRMHAVLAGSEHCIATYPGDFAQVLIAFDATVDITGPRVMRNIPFAALHRPPADAPHIETQLQPGEIITAFVVPSLRWGKRSLFLKIRDRQSYEFALASAVVALDVNDGRVRDVRIALGGVATVPWRATAAEAALRGKPTHDTTWQTAADAAFAEARGYQHNAFKVELGKRTLRRALAQTAAMEI
jgi:xanthine dehydrogenase YagS FAD-binding subunit